MCFTSWDVLLDFMMQGLEIVDLIKPIPKQTSAGKRKSLSHIMYDIR